MYWTPEDGQRAVQRYRTWPWSLAWERLLRIEEEMREELPVRTDPNRFNWLLERTRLWIKYFHSLTVLETVEPTPERERMRNLLLEDVLAWPSWSWQGDYDLSTGELAVCLSGVLRFLSERLSASMTERLATALRERVLAPYESLVLAAGAGPAWWWKDSGNWGAVCNAGAYCAGLGLSAEKVTASAWEGLENFVTNIPADGGSHESISYWQYGYRYLTYALLFRRACGNEPPEMLRKPPLAEGTRFFTAFLSGSASVGFGDCSFVPPEALLLRFCDLVGDTTGRGRLEEVLIAWLQADKPSVNGARYIWNQPREAQSLLFLEGNGEAEGLPDREVICFPETGWASLRNGPLLLGFRAGDNTGAHAMRDQLAVNLAVDGTTFLRYTENHPYTAGWFDEHREATRELYFEGQSVSKNTIAVNGIGQIRCGKVPLLPLEDGAAAEAAELYPAFVEKARRSVLLDEEGFLLKDEIVTTEPCFHEIRFFTDGEVDIPAPGRLRIRIGDRHLCLSCSAGTELVSLVLDVVPSIGVREGWRMLRILTREAVEASVLVTRLRPDFPVKSGSDGTSTAQTGQLKEVFPQ